MFRKHFETAQILFKEFGEANSRSYLRKIYFSQTYLEFDIQKNIFLVEKYFNKALTNSKNIYA